MRCLPHGLALGEVIRGKVKEGKANLCQLVGSTEVENRAELDAVPVETAGQEILWWTPLTIRSAEELGGGSRCVDREVEDREAIRWIPPTPLDPGPFPTQGVVSRSLMSEGLVSKRAPWKLVEELDDAKVGHRS